jgi:hypothetical protein
LQPQEAYEVPPQEVPSSKQISSFLAEDRRRVFGPDGNVTIESLRRSVEELQEVPDDVDDGYVLGSSISMPGGEEKSFVMVWSTIRLSTLDIGDDVVYCDCTYECTWNGFPVTIIGFSDKNCTF